MVPVVCGRCGRVLDRLDEHANDTYPDGGPLLGSAIGEGWSVGADGSPKRSKPSTRRRVDEARERYRFDCHRRCGATYVVRRERLTVAYLDRADTGAAIVAGVDV